MRTGFVFSGVVLVRSWSSPRRLSCHMVDPPQLSACDDGPHCLWCRKLSGWRREKTSCSTHMLSSFFNTYGAVSKHIIRLCWRSWERFKSIVFSLWLSRCASCVIYDIFNFLCVQDRDCCKNLHFALMYFSALNSSRARGDQIWAKYLVKPSLQMSVFLVSD